MAEENQTPDQTPQQEEPRQLTDLEQRAMSQGWVPQDQWDGDPDGWRPAKEFLDRGELFKKIDDVSRTAKEYKKVIEDLKKHNARMEEAGYRRALSELQARKKEALTEGDADAVIEIDERIAEVRDAQKTAAAQVEKPLPEPPTVNPMFEAWTERNSWYTTNEEMKVYADYVGARAAASGNVSPADVLSLVEREVKKKFAEKFQNPNRNKPGAVESSTNKGTSSKSDDLKLNDEERRIMQRIVRTGVMTEKEYVEQLKQAKKQGV